MSDAGRRWLVLVHQLPPRPSHLRVRIWRRLQQVGAVVLRNSLYVLPATAEAREDFEWVREEIMTSGGQVSVLEATAVDGHTDAELIEQFRRLSTNDYEELAGAIRALGQRGKPQRGATEAVRSLRAMRERFTAIQGRDYFAAPGRERVEQAFSLATRAASGHTATAAAGPRLRAQDYRGRTWVTRPRPGIDRFASAWLVRTFVDPGAKFAFAASSRALKRGQIPFDMPEVEFGHHGADCTFETLVRRFGIDRPGVVPLGRVVHDLDFKESRYGMPECAAVARLVDGLRERFDDDAELLEHGIVTIDALHRSLAANRQAPAAKSPRPRGAGRTKPRRST
jgi:hypothetical protein